MTGERKIVKVSLVIALLHIVVGVTGNENPFLDLVRSKISSPYYLDKSEFIKVFNEEKSPIYFTAPPSFGKTINLWMLRSFYGVNVDKNGSIMQYVSSENHRAFKRLKSRNRIGPTVIESRGFMRVNFGSLPVIYMSFKDLNVDTFDSFLKSFSAMCAQSFKEHRYLISSKKLHSVDKVTLSHYASTAKSKKEVHLIFAGEQLSSFLYRHFGQRCIVLIDDFDTPVLKMLTGGSSREKEILVVLREFISALVKDNDYIHHAFLTGNTKLAKFYCPDNIVHYQHNRDEHIARFFGHTEKEIQVLVNSFNDKNVNLAAEVLRFCNGYVIGKSQERVCNPYSVSTFLKLREDRVYWPKSQFMTREYKQFLDLVVHLDSVRETADSVMAGNSKFLSPYEDLDLDDIMRIKSLLTPPSSTTSITPPSPIHGGYTIEELLLELGYFTLKDRTDFHGLLTVPNTEIRHIFSEFLAESWRLKFKTSEEASEAFAIAAISLKNTKSSCQSFAESVVKLFANAPSLPQNEVDLASPLASFLSHYGTYYASLDVKRDNVTRSNIVALQKTKDSEKLDASNDATGLIIGTKYLHCDQDPLRNILDRDYSKVLHPWDESKVIKKFILVGVCFERTEKLAQMKFSFLYNSTNVKDIHSVTKNVGKLK